MVIITSGLQLRIEEIMVKDVIKIHMEKSIVDVLKLLVEKDISGVVVVDNAGEVVGIISALDIFKLFNGGGPMDAYHAEDIMTPYSINITPDATLEDAAMMMLEHGIHRLVVTKSPGTKKPVGIISSTDVMKILKRSL